MIIYWISRIFLLIICCNKRIICANIYSKYTTFTPEQITWVNAKYYANFYTPASNYATYTSEVQNLYMANPTLLSQYHLYIFQSGSYFYINPCNYNYQTCETEILAISSDLLNDNPVVDSSEQFMFAWKMPIYSYECSEYWDLKDICGTNFEVHRPFDETILSDFEQPKVIPANTWTFSTVDITNLCAGKYEVPFFLILKK